LIGRLHKLAARRVAAAGAMAGAVFGRVAHVQQVDSAACVGLHGGERRLVDHANARCPREALRAFQREVGGPRRAGRMALGAPVDAAQARKLPAHRAIAQGHDLVGDAGAAQALGTQDAARAARAVHHHQRLGIGC
jgi:hypothetical protein